ncbi:MAG: LemA family protein [Patescibacteria group bacterium]
MTLPKNKTLWVLIALAAIILAWVWTGYNGLIQLQGQVDSNWAQVETQYQRRFDLVPNLVNTVKGAADFEQETFTAVTQARSQWQSAANRREQITAASGFDSALSRLLVTVESYPQLQATQAFRDLMAQLEGTENRIATARRDFNEAVRVFNIRAMRFPSNILASIFSFKPEMYFENAEGAEEVPMVDFGQ